MSGTLVVSQQVSGKITSANVLATPRRAALMQTTMNITLQSSCSLSVRELEKDLIVHKSVFKGPSSVRSGY